MTRTRALAAVALGGLAALLVVGTALAHPGGRFVDRVEVLARALGITSGDVEQARENGTLKNLLADVSRDDLRAAYEEEAREAIDGASEAGDITPAQADRLKELIRAERGGLTGDEIDTLKSLRGAVRTDVSAAYASALGITTAEVEAAKEDGTLRGRLATVNRLALAAALVEARDAAIDEAEAAGEISSEQAELLRDAGRGRGGYRIGHRGVRAEGSSLRGRGHRGRSGDYDPGGGNGALDGKKRTTPAGDPE